MEFLINALPPDDRINGGSNQVQDRTKIIQTASWIALLGNLVLSSSKIGIGILSKSLAVLSDGADSATDVLIAIMTLIAARITSKPGDKEHPYGHGRVETVASAVISFVLFFAGAQILSNAVMDLIENTKTDIPATSALWVTIFSILGKLILAWSQFALGKKSGSSMLIANGKNMRGDVVTSIAVLIGLILTYITGLPALDKVLAILVACWIIKNAIGIFMEANTELMDGTSDHGPYKDLFLAVSKVPEAGNPHRARIRRLGSMLMVDLDIEVAPGMSVKEAHQIAMRVEASIKKQMSDVYDVIVHIEPKGNVENERFGLSEEDAIFP
jgi:cation diffusion facilitator family transporter